MTRNELEIGELDAAFAWLGRVDERLKSIEQQLERLWRTLEILEREWPTPKK